MKPFEHLLHRHPFVMLDRAEVIEENRRARGTRRVTMNDPVVLPNGTMPQAYIIEAMAQISGIASGRRGGSLFAAINGLIFTGTARAGETLEVESSVERNIGSLYSFAARASVAGNIIAEGGILLHFDESA
jgi:3-hydroxyacyl-[acyl-carrier-protein] dehydratase